MSEYLTIAGFYLTFGATMLLLLVFGIKTVYEGLGVGLLLFILVCTGFILISAVGIANTLEIPGW